jgi:hypothetical protein
MKTTPDTSCFVLREGSTQEERWDWEAIKEMCASGQFSPDTRIFSPETNTWVRAGDTELDAVFAAANRNSRNNKTAPEIGEDTTELRSDYNAALDQISANPDRVDAHVHAGNLAAELKDREAARRHFQAALDLQPYNSRVAHEVKRKFSKNECGDFSLLEREPPVWDNLTDLVAFPLSWDIRYLGVVAAGSSVFLFVPYGGYALCALYFLWCVQVARHTAAGSVNPPLWDAAAAEPVRELFMPLVAGLLVFTEFFLVFFGIARLSMLAGGESSTSVLGFMRNSPILVVLMYTVGIAYFPAVFVHVSDSAGKMFGLLNPWKIVKSAVRMEHEYLMTVFVLFAVGLAVGVIRLLTGGIPVLGKIFLAAALAYALPIAGLTVGRLLSRMRHVL